VTPAEIATLVAEQVTAYVATRSDAPRVALQGRAATLGPELTRLIDVPVDTGTGASETQPVPSPHVAVVWLDDGGTARDERLALLRETARLLHPGGRLVVVGYVVTPPGGAANPSIAALIQDLHEATGTMVHLEELRSFRCGVQPWSRGVLLGLTYLHTGRI
jgi:hypothetical protein